MRFLSPVWLVLCGVLMLRCGGDRSAPSANQSTPTPAAAAFTPAARTLADASLTALVARFKAAIPGQGTNAFIEPSAADIETFRSCLQVLFAGDGPRAAGCLAPLGYGLGMLNDTSRGRSYFVAEESGSPRGLGLYVVDPRYSRNIVVAVPHPLFDVNTPEQSVRIMQEIGARALFVAGTHRCASSAASPCSGTTTACGSSAPHRVSDACHFPRNFMHAAQRSAYALAPMPRSFNIHGNSSEPRDIVLSDGTANDASDAADVNWLRNNLMARAASVGSCNVAPDRAARLVLCGQANTDGRLFNGSAEPCTQNAVTASGRFLHLEQRRNIRDDPTVLIAALREVFSEDGPR